MIYYEAIRSIAPDPTNHQRTGDDHQGTGEGHRRRAQPPAESPQSAIQSPDGRSGIGDAWYESCIIRVLEEGMSEPCEHEKLCNHDERLYLPSVGGIKPYFYCSKCGLVKEDFTGTPHHIHYYHDKLLFLHQHIHKMRLGQLRLIRRDRHLPTTEVVGLPLRKKSRGVWQGDASP